jgi:hypothetical protein
VAIHLCIGIKPCIDLVIDSKDFAYNYLV